MNDKAIRYAVLRGRRTWEEGVKITGLQTELDGILTLTRIPGLANGQIITLPGPFDMKPSGLAMGHCDDLYITDTIGNRIIRIDGVCKSRTVLPCKDSSVDILRQFHSPRGLLIAPSGDLYVADSDNGKIQILRLPTLELHNIWEGLLREPIGLAADSQGRVYVLDRGLKRVLRFSGLGIPDETYNNAMSVQPDLVSPFCLTIDNKDTLYVTDDQANSVLRFDPSGSAFGALPKVGSEFPIHPRTILSYNERLYIADASDGRIWIFDCTSEEYLGTIHNYRGPVAAMAIDKNGTLYIKSDLGETYHCLLADSAYVPSGRLVTGPLDAGEGNEWERVHIQAEVSEGTDVKLQTFMSDNQAVAPMEKDWVDANALDMILPPLPVVNNQQPRLRRYLWLRVLLESDDQRKSPRLMQVQAETVGENYMDYLPAVYRRNDEPDRFLERWLKLFRSELGDWELTLEEMHRNFDPATSPEDNLSWLATWLAFEPPQGMRAEALRQLLLRIHKLYNLRGTPNGICEFIELYTGVRPNIFEAFRERRIWQLEHASVLGCDTFLAPALPDGIIVPGLTLADPQYMGLRGEYYAGMDFGELKHARTDPKIELDWKNNLPDLPVPKILAGTFPKDHFSVRWTGQILPRYSETYTFSVVSDYGIRLWIDGYLLVDNWKNPSAKENTRQITLTAGKWYTIQLEYFNLNGDAIVKLYWSSRSQRKEIIPQDCLYSVRDEGARLASTSQGTGSEIILVGQTVVGQSGPLAASEFGLPLFNETAHLFTIMVHAAKIPEPKQRQVLKQVIETEKPAHTDFHLCLVNARMRVGFQARIGIDSIIAGPPKPMEMSDVLLGFDSYLGTEAGEGKFGRVGKQSHIGQDLIIE